MTNTEKQYVAIAMNIDMEKRELDLKIEKIRDRVNSGNGTESDTLDLMVLIVEKGGLNGKMETLLTLKNV